MQEYVTDAIVLLKQPSGEQDGRYSFFTKRFGKIIGRAKSSRKITSKLASHLEPGNLLKVRFIEQKGMQVVDALKTARTEIPLHDLELLNSLLSEMDVDEALWGQIAYRQFSWSGILRILGWDPEEAVCAHCGKKEAAYFYIPRQEFFCSDCVSKLKADAVSLIDTR
jgi:recombinational DNA repair protein (RecF pathway)